MTTEQEIEKAISQLPKDDLAVLVDNSFIEIFV